MLSTLWELVGAETLLLAQAESEAIASVEMVMILKTLLLARLLMT